MIKTIPSMSTAAPKSLSDLYLADETAWLDAMSDLAAQGRPAAINLADMARRDRREVVSRLVVLMTHLLQWLHQPQNRSGSWRGTIRAQRRELRELLESGTLPNEWPFAE